MQAFAGIGIPDPKHFLWKAAAKLTIQPQEVRNACCISLQIFAMIDEPLNLNVGDGLVLQRPLLRIGGVVG